METESYMERLEIYWVSVFSITFWKTMVTYCLLLSRLQMPDNVDDDQEHLPSWTQWSGGPWSVSIERWCACGGMSWTAKLSGFIFFMIFPKLWFTFCRSPSFLSFLLSLQLGLSTWIRILEFLFFSRATLSILSSVRSFSSIHFLQTQVTGWAWFSIQLNIWSKIECLRMYPKQPMKSYCCCGIWLCGQWSRETRLVDT